MSIDERGVLTERYGNGIGFALGAVSGWTAATNPEEEITWSAEFRISRAKLGNPTADRALGLQIRQDSVLVPNDYFAWPQGSIRWEPESWADLVVPGEAPGIVHVGGARVTQGLDIDGQDGTDVPVDFILGKDAMMEGNLYTVGDPAAVIYSACQVERLSPTWGQPQVLPVDQSLHPRVSRGPAAFGSMGMFRCWVPGSLITSPTPQDPAIFRFSLIVQLSGGPRRTLDLGTRWAQPSRSLRVLIQRAERPPGYPTYRAWDTTLNTAAMSAMTDLQRVVPLPAGIGPVATLGTPPAGAAGLRLLFAPGVDQCTPQSAETTDQAATRCAWAAPLRAELTRMDYNRQWAQADAADGQHRDRLDLQELLVASTRADYGHSCNSWTGAESSASSAVTQFDNSPGTASHDVSAATESCWGQPSEASPHFSLRGPVVPLTDGNPLINTQTHQEITEPISVLRDTDRVFPLGFDHSRLTTEGWDFNDLRTRLLQWPTTPPWLGRQSAGHPGRQLEVAFGLDASTTTPTVTPFVSRALSGTYLEPSTPASGSAYSLAIRDSSGALISRLPFAGTRKRPGGGRTTGSGQVLIVNLPDRTASFAIEYQGAGKPLLRQVFTKAAPTVDALTTTTDGAKVYLSWTAADPDSTDLRYDVYFAAHPGALRHLVASGLTDPAYVFDTSFAPGTTDGEVTVEATDGVNTGSATIGGIAIDAKAPIVGIVGPDHPSLAQGGSLELSGAASDQDSLGTLAGKALTWTVDKTTPLGTGERVSLAGLAPGSHEVTLTATSAAGLPATATTTITVLPDGDQDGIPDQVETASTCLNPTVFDAMDDPDADGLSSYAEWQHGSDPCNPDSDSDGAADGAEVTGGGDPTSATVRPLPAGLYVTSEPLDLGTCSAPTPAKIPVTLVKKAPWTVRSDAAYVAVAGGGTTSGLVTVAPKCARLAAGQRYSATLIFRARGGQLHTLTASVTT